MLLEQPIFRRNNVTGLQRGVDCGALDPKRGTFPAGSETSGDGGCCDIRYEPPLSQ